MSDAQKAPPETFEEFCNDPDVRQRIREAGRLIRDAEQRALIDRLYDEMAEKDGRHAANLTAQKAGFETAISALSGAMPAKVTPASPLLSAAVEAYMRMKRVKGDWKPKTEEAIRASFNLFREAIGDQPVAEIDNAAVVSFYELLQKLPPNRTKVTAYQGKTLAEIVELGHKPMTDRTAHDYIVRISQLFKWCMEQKGYGVTHNPAQGLAGGKPSGTTRRPFSLTELAALFQSHEFTTRKFENSYAYWLMPMALYTGARLGELCQLELSNFIEVDGIACIEITDQGERQSVKNANAKRLIPIHSELIRLGLLRHLERLRDSGMTRLFSEINLEPTPSHEASRWFARYRKRCGLVESGIVFHSFRHTFITHLADKETADEHIAPIVGHDTGRITSQVYWNKKDVSKRKPIVERFTLPEEIRTLMPCVEHVTLGGGADASST